MTKQQSADRDSAILKLRETLKPGMTVYTNLKHVSRSGMMRHITLHLATAEGIEDITYLVARIIQEPRDANTGALKVGGCGSDVGFDAVYSLGRVLFRDGFTCTGEGCRSNDHSNGDRDYSPHLHSDPGYALRHRWI